jgi:hypothetical protein
VLVGVEVGVGTPPMACPASAPVPAAAVASGRMNRLTALRLSSAWSVAPGLLLGAGVAGAGEAALPGVGLAPSEEEPGVGLPVGVVVGVPVGVGLPVGVVVGVPVGVGLPVGLVDGVPVGVGLPVGETGAVEQLGVADGLGWPRLRPDPAGPPLPVAPLPPGYDASDIGVRLGWSDDEIVEP